MKQRRVRFDRYPVFCITVLLLGLASFTGPVAAQDTTGTEQEAEQPGDTAPEAPEKVDVNPVARDDEIATRLTDILDTTRYFRSSSVEVQDGVVFLEGEAREEEFRKWASDLASKTQDVVAVVNRMSVTRKSVWDFSEAFAELRDFRTNAIQAIPFILFGLAILALTWLLAKLIGYLAGRALSRRVPNSLLRWVATRAFVVPVILFGIYLVLRVSGLTQLALTVLGGTGLVGLVIGIAFQDIAENFLASVLISVQKPFRIGDLVRVDEYEGIVQRVTTRGTTLMTHDGNHVQIPNSKIYKSVIENYTANPMRRLSFDVGIGYDDSTSEAQEVVLKTIKNHSATLNDPQPRVLIQSLGASTVNLRALFWIDGTKNDWPSVRSSCMRIAKQALMKAGISMPDESREVIFPNGVPVQMDESAETGVTPPTDRAALEQDLQFSGTPGTKGGSPPDALDQVHEKDSSEAEGNMKSELDDLQRQAAHSWLPGEGEELLVAEDESPEMQVDAN